MNQLTAEQIDALLSEVQVGRLATLNDDGFPYILSVCNRESIECLDWR